MEIVAVQTKAIKEALSKGAESAATSSLPSLDDVSPVLELFFDQYILYQHKMVMITMIAMITMMAIIMIQIEDHLHHHPNQHPYLQIEDQHLCHLN